MLIFTWIGGSAASQSYENVWYGYNSFIADKHQNVFLISCGRLSDENNVNPFFNIMETVRVTKVSDALSLEFASDEKWIKQADAKFGPTMISFNYRRVDISFDDFTEDAKLKLVRTLRHLVPNYKQKPEWSDPKNTTQKDFKKFFVILNQVEIEEVLNLADGYYAMHKPMYVTIEFITRKNTINGTQALSIKGEKFELKDQGYLYRCLSLKEF